MGRTEIEIGAILSTLAIIYWRYTDPSTGISNKPHGLDWICVERSIYRLLVLRGTIKLGDKFYENPWHLYLNEYAPAGMRRSISLGQGQSHIFQSSTLMASTTSVPTSTVSSGDQGRGRQPANCDGQQQQPQRRVCFLDTPSPARGRAPRRLPLSPAPNARFR